MATSCPYGQPWRLGANQATKMTFSTDVKIGGKDLKAGAYAVLATPEMDKWTLHFYPPQQHNFGSYLRDEEAESVDVVTMVDQMSGPGVGSFLIMFDNLTNSTGTLLLGWDKTIAIVEVEVPTNAAVEEMIASTMAGPSANDYRAAASYYLAGR